VQNPSSVGVAERLDLGMERTALMSSARRCEGAEAEFVQDEKLGLCVTIAVVISLRVESDAGFLGIAEGNLVGRNQALESVPGLFGN
jgi:hypothetical protein